MGPAEMSQRLRHLSAEMIDLGTSMDYFGGFDSEIVRRGREMVGAGQIAKLWADEIDSIVRGGELTDAHNVKVRGQEAALSPEAPSRLPGSTPGANEERTGNA